MEGSNGHQHQHTAEFTNVPIGPNYVLTTGEQPIFKSEHEGLVIDDQEAPPPPAPDALSPQKLMIVRTSAVLSASCFFIWLLTCAKYGVLPWFIYPTLVTMAIYAGFTIKNDTLRLNFVLTSLAQLTIWLTWLFSRAWYPWFIWAFFPLWIPVVVQYIKRNFSELPLYLFYVHLSIFSNINLMLFITWYITWAHGVFPWFIYPFHGWAFLLIIQYDRIVFPGERFKLHLHLFINLNTMLFLTGVFTNSWPWFFVVLISTGAFLVAHGFICKNRGFTRAPSAAASAAPAPPAPQVPAPAVSEYPAAPRASSNGYQPVFWSTPADVAQRTAAPAPEAAILVQQAPAPVAVQPAAVVTPTPVASSPIATPTEAPVPEPAPIATPFVFMGQQQPAPAPFPALPAGYMLQPTANGYFVVVPAPAQQPTDASKL